MDLAVAVVAGAGRNGDFVPAQRAQRGVVARPPRQRQRRVLVGPRRPREVRPPERGNLHEGRAPPPRAQFLAIGADSLDLQQVLAGRELGPHLGQRRPRLLHRELHRRGLVPGLVDAHAVAVALHDRGQPRRARHGIPALLAKPHIHRRRGLAIDRELEAELAKLALIPGGRQRRERIGHVLIHQRHRFADDAGDGQPVLGRHRQRADVEGRRRGAARHIALHRVVLPYLARAGLNRMDWRGGFLDGGLHQRRGGLGGVLPLFQVLLAAAGKTRRIRPCPDRGRALPSLPAARGRLDRGLDDPAATDPTALEADLDGRLVVFGQTGDVGRERLRRALELFRLDDARVGVAAAGIDHLAGLWIEAQPHDGGDVVVAPVGRHLGSAAAIGPRHAALDHPGAAGGRIDIAGHPAVDRRDTTSGRCGGRAAHAAVLDHRVDSPGGQGAAGAPFAAELAGDAVARHPQAAAVDRVRTIFVEGRQRGAGLAFAGRDRHDDGDRQRIPARGQAVLQPKRQMLVGGRGYVRDGKGRQNKDKWLHVGTPSVCFVLTGAAQSFCRKS